MPDWNADKEGHRKYKYLVHDATREHLESVPTTKGDLKFNDEGRLVVHDKTLADEIRTSEAGKRSVCVSRVNGDSPADRDHTYFFGSFQGVPWAKYDELGRRIPEGQANDGQGRDGNLQASQERRASRERDGGADAGCSLPDGDVQGADI